MEAPETQGKRTVFVILVSSCVFFSAVKVIRLVRFQGRQGGFMSSKAQAREKDYERGKWLGQYETEDAAVEMLREMAKDDGGYSDEI